MRVVVTGATGFVGRAVCRVAAELGHEVRPLGRADTGDLAGPVPWERLLEGADAVIHLAARVHVMQERATDPLAAFRVVNVEPVRQLAAAAPAAGVRRIVLASSVKVLGEGRPTPYTEADLPAPTDPYGQSKLEAEHAVLTAPGVEAVVIRPPLVYGPGVGGNFRRLLRLARLAAHVPLPLGAVRNRRSMVFVDNLADAMVRVVAAPQASGQTYLVRDGEDVATSDLLRRIGRARGRPVRLVSVPPPVLRAGLALIGRRAEADRLLGSLMVDDARLRADLGWSAPIDVDTALARTVTWFDEAQP